MNHWPSQLFPRLMISCLAALTFWLQRQRHNIANTKSYYSLLACKHAQ